MKIYIDWLESELEEARAKAETNKQLNQPPSFPYEYELFLDYFQRNQGDFRKTVHALTFDGQMFIRSHAMVCFETWNIMGTRMEMKNGKDGNDALL